MNEKFPKPSSCQGCVGCNWSGGKGYVPSSGTGDNGVLILGEAAGEHEAQEGQGFVGKAGLYLFQNLQRAGIYRDGFKIDNIIHCRPPNNRLVGEAYEASVIASCRQYLDATIREMQEKCKVTGKTFVILTLGRVAFKAVMGYQDRDPIMRKDYIAYPFRSEAYQAWVIPAYHPSFLMRGKTELVPILQFATQRALEIADKGLQLAVPDYLLDPSAPVFETWVDEFLRYQSLAFDTPILSYDIETPMKQGEDEEEVAKEDDDDYTILRVSFSYRPNEAVSIPWRADYIPALQRIFAQAKILCGWNSQGYDRPRIEAHMPVLGAELDGMLMWHVLNSALPKGLGFVTPFYVHNTEAWKYLSDAQPAFYNAKDADMALQNVLGIRRDLVNNNLWPVFETHVLKVHEVFHYMSKKGVPLDMEARQSAEVRLSAAMESIETRMEAVIPKEVRSYKIFKKKPKETDGLEEVIKQFETTACSVCSRTRPAKRHFVSKLAKSCGKCGKKWTAKHVAARKKANPCLDAVCIETEINSCLSGTPIRRLENVTCWAKPLEFKLSKKSLTTYQKSLMHSAIRSRKENRVTFDEKAILQLVKKYKNDPLYPLILAHRGTQKLLSTYVGVTQPSGLIRGGIPIGVDGRVHTTFTSNPSTLRSASQKPNLQNIPRPNGADSDDPANLIRNFFKASDGNILTARDFSGIEAKLVGYFASDPDYMRLCAIDVHSFYTAHAVSALDGRIKSYDLPDLSWDDQRLTDYLAHIKKAFKPERNNLYKHLVHAANFGQKERGAAEKILLETGIVYPVETIKRVMDIYYELFPKIKKWHWAACLQVESDGFLQNPFGYIHRFSRPMDYEWISGKCHKSPGVDANRVWAFLPQSTAAGIIKEAMLRLYNQRFEEAGQYLRLLIHDELFSECPEALVDQVDAVVREEMEKPILCMPLPDSYGMGSHLIVGTEAKKGYRWGQMR